MKCTVPLRRPSLITLALTCALILTAVSLRAQADELQPLFSEEVPLEITVALDFDAVMSDRSEDPHDQPATLYVTRGGPESVHGIGVRTRGFYRLHYLDCDVPPLRINFEKDEVEGTVFEGQDKLKLVTHCKNGSDRYQQYVFQEYLIYKAYTLVTEMSFHVRLVHLTYVDARGRREPVTGFGFLIEDEDLMAARNGAAVIDDAVTIFPSATDQETMTQVAIFQYMIGNTDWTVSTHHNVKLVLVDSTRTLHAVPYDFDWSGLISTPYAKPFEELKLRSVRERLFMGLCRTEEEFTAISQRFLDVRNETLALFSDFEYLNDRTARQTVDYLEQFFGTIERPRLTRRAFLSTCL